jgi:hypothetical protein
VEGASAVCREENNWRVNVDVLEVPRIPDTTSLLATYEVDLDEDGKLDGHLARLIARLNHAAPLADHDAIGAILHAAADEIEALVPQAASEEEDTP